MEPVRFAIIDGAIESELLHFLTAHTPPHCCLYSPPVQPELAELAPYLVQITPEVDDWLKSKTTPWGITLYCAVTIHKLLQHLRHYLWVKIPGQDKPVLMRFYDPRIIWTLTEVLTAQQLTLFVEPVAKIMTDYNGIHLEDSFSSAREAVTDHDIYPATGALVLETWQFKKLNQLTELNYARKLAAYIHNYLISEKVSPTPVGESIFRQAEDTLYFCHSFDIIDSRSVRGITLLFLKKGINDSNNIPSEWETLLSDKEQSIHYRVENLLLQELGYIPE